MTLTQALTATVGWCVQLMQFDAAEADCDKALKLELNVKTLLRRGTARRGKQDIDGARRDFKHALELEPNNRWDQVYSQAPKCVMPELES